MSRWLALIVVLVGLPLLAMEPPLPPKPLTEEQQEKLKERDRLLQKAKRLFDDSKVDEAIDLVEKALALTREVRAEHHPEVLKLCLSLAQAYEQQANFPAAKKHRQHVLATLTQLHGKDHWQVTDALLALEDVERLAQLTPTARRRLEEAGQLNRQAVQLYQQGKTREGIALAQKAVQIRQEVQGERHPDYAASLNNLALLYQDQGE
jgi:tetratricopeptide (TPR) repeat protein